MKYSFPLAILIFFQSFLFGQLNGDFESWSTPIQEAPFDWVEPVGWSTSNPITDFLQHPVVKDIESYSGESAVLIRSTFLLGEWVPGTLILGQVGINYQSMELIPTENGMPLDMEPAFLNGWYKFRADSINARAVARVEILRYDIDNGNSTVLKDVTQYLMTNKEYTAFQLPIDLNEEFDSETDQIRIYFYSHDGEHQYGHAELKIDDLKLDFVSAADSYSKYPANVFPNPVKMNDHFYVQIPENIFEKEIIIDVYNSFGSRIEFQKVQTPVDRQITISALGWAAGVYFIYCNGINKWGRIIVY